MRTYETYGNLDPTTICVYALAHRHFVVGTLFFSFLFFRVSYGCFTSNVPNSNNVNGYGNQYKIIRNFAIYFCNKCSRTLYRFLAHIRNVINNEK